MKPAIDSLTGILLITMFILSCEKEQNDDQQIIKGQLTNYSGCKNFLKSGPEMFHTADSFSCIHYTYYPSTNELILQHINAGFNCCPEKIYGKFFMTGDTIVIEEFEASALCDCNCLYDLNIKLNGIAPKKYRVKFIEPYCGNQEKLIFNLDLAKDTNGSYCVTRKQYPWGIYSMN